MKYHVESFARVSKRVRILSPAVIRHDRTAKNIITENARKSSVDIIGKVSAVWSIFKVILVHHRQWKRLCTPPLGLYVVQVNTARIRRGVPMGNHPLHMQVDILNENWTSDTKPRSYLPPSQQGLSPIFQARTGGYKCPQAQR